MIGIRIDNNNLMIDGELFYGHPESSKLFEIQVATECDCCNGRWIMFERIGEDEKGNGLYREIEELNCQENK